jgi:L-asparaginase II
MDDFRIEWTRGDRVESLHRVSVAVVNADGALLAQAGDPDLLTFWRSAAKPFQALPLVEDGGYARLGLTERELALACASHSSEPDHVALAGDMLARIGQTESALACGPHPPLSSSIAERVVRDGTVMSPRWSNCSGKHTGMLAQAVHHGWPVEGYNEAEHPLQQRILDEIVRWSGVPRDRIELGVDGCNTVCFGLPLSGMARAYARLAASEEPGARTVREAMMHHPWLVAGTGRPCTELMEAYGGRLLAKLGAEGVYCAAFVPSGIGIALKVEDGDMKSLPVALLAVLRQVLERGLVPGIGSAVPEHVERHAGVELRNTRDRVTGVIRPAGELRFSAQVPA